MGMSTLLPNPTILFKEKFAKCIFSQFCFIPGEQMSTLWANGDKGYKIDLGAAMQRTVLFNLTQEVYPTPPSSSRKNLWVGIFSQFCFIPDGQMSTLWANGQGLKIDLGIECSVPFSLTSHKMFYQPHDPLQEKIR